MQLIVAARVRLVLVLLVLMVVNLMAVSRGGVAGGGLATGLWGSPAWADAVDSSDASAESRQRRVRTVLGGEYWIGQVADDVEGYLAYLEQVRPDVIHGGVLGPELASNLGTTDRPKAISEISPQSETMADYHQWWSDYLPRVQASDIRVQATISMVNAWGDHATGRGWFRYYAERWDDDLLGPRPVDDVTELMERRLDGSLIHDGSGDYQRYGGCVNNPHWREVLKRFVEAGIEAGFDGFMVQFPHARTSCACEHCQTAFRQFLERRHDPEVLEQRLGISDLAGHVFDTTGPRSGMPAWIDLEARQFAAESVLACYEEVFIEHGRSLKPDLVVSLWTHHRQFFEPDVQFQKAMTNTEIAAVMDERLLLPMDRWGRGEDYLWYSTPAYFSDLEAGLLGDTNLTSRYLHAMGGGRPFVTLKYDYFRWRVTTAEAMAFGGATFGSWRGGWSGGEDREDPHLGSYFQFIRDNSGHLWPREAGGEVAVIYPRRSFFNGSAEFLEPLRQWGEALHREHVLFDMLIDQQLTAEALAGYDLILTVAPQYLNEREMAWLDEAVQRGAVVVHGAGPEPATPEQESDDAQTPAPAMQRDDRGWYLYTGDMTDAAAMTEALRASATTPLSRFDAPWTVQVHAHRQQEAGQVLVHLINYERDESQGRSELPIATTPIDIDLQLPPGATVRAVHVATPEQAEHEPLTFEQADDRLTLQVPGFLVYALLVVEVD